MNPRNTAILFCLAGAMFAFIFFYERKLQREKTEVLRVLPGFDEAEVSTIRVELFKQPEIRAVRGSNGWQITKPLEYPAQSAMISNLLAALKILAPSPRLTARDLQGHGDVNAEYGLDQPQATVIFEQGSQQRQIKFGAYTAPGDQIYTEVVGADGVDVVDAAFFRNLIPHNPNDWRETLLLNGLDSDYTSLVVSGGQQPLISFQLQRTTARTPWSMVKPVETRADPLKINTALSALRAARISSFVSDSPSVDLDAYGLHPPVMELGFLRGTNLLIGIQFGKSPTNDTNQVFARITGQPSIVAVPREAVAPWQAGFQEFRDRHLTRFDPASLDSIAIEGEEDALLRRETDGSWKVSGASLPETITADKGTMGYLLSALTNIQVVTINRAVAIKDTVPPDAASLEIYGLAKPIRRYVIRARKNSLPMGVTNEVVAALDFGTSKEGLTFARRSDLPAETSVYAVVTDDLNHLPRRALHFQKPRLWEFTENDVASITVRQNGVTQKIIRKAMAQWSVAEGIKSSFNELEAEVGAQELGALDAHEWIQCGDANSTQYGFGEGDTRFTVELKKDGAALEKSFEIGSLSPDGLRYGCTVLSDGRKWIFTLSAKTYDRLAAYFSLHDPAARP